MPPSRILVVDENLNPRLATEIARRGRQATRVAELGPRGSLDPQLLHRIDAQLEDWVLVTADDALPGEHSDAAAAVGATIATIHPDRHPEWALESWRREIVHRWAHVIQDQPAGTARRYGLQRHARWTPRRRRAMPPTA